LRAPDHLVAPPGQRAAAQVHAADVGQFVFGELTILKPWMPL